MKKNLLKLQRIRRKRIEILSEESLESDTSKTMCLICQPLRPENRAHVICARLADNVTRINITEDRSRIQRLPINGQITIHLADVCHSDYAILNEFDRLQTLNLSYLHLCPHTRSDGEDYLPKLQGKLSETSARLRNLFLSNCSLCDRCIQELQLPGLQSACEILLSGNHLTAFPTSLFSLRKCLKEIDLSGNEAVTMQSVEEYLLACKQRGSQQTMKNLEVSYLKPVKKTNIFE